jgi:hypothetical protein
VKLTTLSREDDYWSATSMRNGSPRPVMKRWIYWGFDMVVSRQESAMKRFEYSSKLPVRRNMASSLIGQSVSDSPKRALMSCTNRV